MTNETFMDVARIVAELGSVGVLLVVLGRLVRMYERLLDVLIELLPKREGGVITAIDARREFSPPSSTDK